MLTPHKTTSDLEFLVDDIRFEIDAHDTVIEHYCRWACMTFCKESHFWREDLGPLTVTEGCPIEIVPHRDLIIVQLERVLAENDEGELVEFEQGRESQVNRWSFFHNSVDTFSVAPEDELDGKSLLVECSLMPDIRSNKFSMSTIILDEYLNEIILGAKAKLLMLTGKEWSNPNLGMEYHNTFMRHASDAQVRANQDYARTAKKIQHKPRDFF